MGPTRRKPPWGSRWGEMRKEWVGVVRVRAERVDVVLGRVVKALVGSVPVEVGEG